MKYHFPAKGLPPAWGFQLLTLWSVGRAGSNGGSLSSVLQHVPGEILTRVHAGNIRGCSLQHPLYLTIPPQKGNGKLPYSDKKNELDLQETV